MKRPQWSNLFERIGAKIESKPAPVKFQKTWMALADPDPTGASRLTAMPMPISRFTTGKASAEMVKAIGPAPIEYAYVRQFKHQASTDTCDGAYRGEEVE